MHVKIVEAPAGIQSSSVHCDVMHLNKIPLQLTRDAIVFIIILTKNCESYILNVINKTMRHRYQRHRSVYT